MKERFRKPFDPGLQPPDKNFDDIDRLERTAEWVARYLKIDEAFTDNDIMEYVRKKWKPDEIYSEEDLKRWAIENGYLKTQT